jgi:phosphoenolpyruvate synthase/pyruvate phosphate dikinase
MRRWRSSGKGASPARMAAVGLPVPPGFHITTAACRRLVEANALQAVIAEATATAQPDDPASLERASAAARQLPRAAPCRTRSLPLSALGAPILAQRS